MSDRPMKLYFLLFLPWLFASCSSTTKLSPEMIKKNERLIVMRLSHLNDQGDWSNSTSIAYRIDKKKAPGMSAPFITKREENGLRFVIIPEQTKMFGLDDIIFGHNGLAYKFNPDGNNSLAEVPLPSGLDPVYVGTIHLISGKKDWSTKTFNSISTLQEVRKVEIKDEFEQVETLLKTRGIKGHLKKAIFKYPEID